MRKLTRFVQLLVVALLFAVPVAAIGAQSGTAVSGYIDDDIIVRHGDAPPETVASGYSGYNDYIDDNIAVLQDVAEPLSPEALPGTGYDRASALRDASVESRFTRAIHASALRDAYAQLRDTGAVTPGTLPESGAAMASRVVPETGTGGELQALIEGLLYRGAGYMPDIVPNEPPVALPTTGSWTGSVTVVGKPEALPVSGVADEPDLPYVAPFPGGSLIDQWIESVGMASE